MLENGKRKLQTHCGVVLTAFVVCLLILYGYIQYLTMSGYKANIIQTPNQPGFFPYDYIYDSSDGWRLAFGLTAYDSSSDPAPFDQTYGTMGAYMKVWGDKDENGDPLPTYFAKL